MIVSEAIVTVTVVIDGITTTFRLARVLDIEVSAKRDQPSVIFDPPALRIARTEPPDSITFSMRPLANIDGEYMRVEVHEAEA